MSTLSQRQFGSSVAWNFNAEATYDGGDGAKENVAIDSMYALGDDYFQNIEEQQDGLHGYSHVPANDLSLDATFPWAIPNGLNAAHCWSVGRDQSASDAPVDGSARTFPSALVGPYAASQATGYGISDTFNKDEMQNSPNQLINGATLPLHLPSALIPVTPEAAAFGGNITMPALGWGVLSGVGNDLYIQDVNVGSPSVFHPEYANAQGTSTGPPSFVGHYHQEELEVPVSFELRKWNSRSWNALPAPLGPQIQHMALPTPKFGLLEGNVFSTQSVPLQAPEHQLRQRDITTENSGGISVSSKIREMTNLRKNTNAEEPALSRVSFDTPTPPSEQGADSLAPTTFSTCKETRRTTKSGAKAATPKTRKTRKTRSPAAKKRVDPKDVLPIKSKASKKTASLECEVCGKKCSHIRSLQKHEELHERTPGTQPVCPNCKGKLSRPDALVRHVKNLYEKDPDNECVKMAQRLGWRYKVRGTGKNLLKGLGQR